MKKMFFISVLSLFGAACLGQWLSTLVFDRAINPQDLPRAAVTFLERHFPLQQVAFSKEDRDFLFKTYEVVLTSGTKLELGRTGAWEEIDTHHEAVPSSLVPEPVQRCVEERFPMGFITRMEREKGQLRVVLDSGHRLTFSRSLQLLETSENEP